MGSQEDDHATTVYGGDLDEDDESEDEDPTLGNQRVDEDDVDMVDDEEEDGSVSSGVGEVTVAVVGVTNAVTTVAATPTTARTSGRINTTPLPQSDAVAEQRKAMPLEDSRRLFQRLWTDEDEIGLLQGFLDYTTQRVVNNSSHHHHDTTAFYDQIKSKLQLDFNKNQLVEKLRRLKKKYRNVLGKISSGKDYVFKSAHDQVTFDISCKIWSTGATVVSTSAPADVGGLDDEEPSNPNPNLAFNLNDHNGNCVTYPNNPEKKMSRSRKRSRLGGVKIEENHSQQHCGQAVGAGASSSSSPIPNIIEETVKTCLLPLFKELLNNSPNGACGSLGGLGLGGMNFNPLSSSFNGSMNFPLGDITDEKWRKQHILELEVCSKRLELVQDQIKSQLEELRSMRS